MNYALACFMPSEKQAVLCFQPYNIQIISGIERCIIDILSL